MIVNDTTVLHDPVLVLNRSWQPISTTTVRAALCLLMREAAWALDPQTYQVYDFEAWSERETGGLAHVRGVSRAFCAPQIIVLRRYSRQPRHRVPFSRRNLFRRDGFRCQYCAQELPASRLSVDHVRPRSRGGVDGWENCVSACLPCNVKKGNRYLHETPMRLLRKPQPPKWSPVMSLAKESRKRSWEPFLSASDRARA